MSGSLVSEEAGADQLYGFPAGTMQALGETESSNGANAGSIGNIFQIEPATAANPGYGLGPLNGNDPYSAGSYLSALESGPAGGSLSTALAMYHGGASSPTPYGASTPIGQLLAGIGGSSSTTSATSPTPTSWLSDLNPLHWLGDGVSAAGSAIGSALGLPKISELDELAVRALIVLVAVTLIGAGFFLAGRPSASTVARAAEVAL